MQSRFLITTADESTWKMDVPVLFLGEWCKLYSRRHIWENMDSQTLSYHWDDRAKFSKDCQFLQNLYENLLTELADKLNSIHDVNYSLRYWRILIGPWLGGLFLPILFDRWSMIEKAISYPEILSAKIHEPRGLQVIANDMQEFVNLMTQDQWNGALYSDLLLHYTKVPVEIIAKSQQSPQIASPQNTFRRRLRRGLIDSIKKLPIPLVRNMDAFFMSTYLPFLQELKLNMQFKQVPALWDSIAAVQVPVDITQRLWTLDGKEKGFAGLARAMIPNYLPRIFLEGYQALQNQIANVPWPKQPKLIFSSNAIWGDDVFKAWAAMQTEKGVSLILGQHGGGYGVSKDVFNEDHEVNVADKYLTWGWDDAKHSNIHPTMMLNSKRTKIIDRRLKSTALFITTLYPRQSYKLISEPLSSQWLNYFEDQCSFVSAVSSLMRQKLVIRLCGHIDQGWCQKQRWQDRFPDLCLDDGTRPITPLINNCRIAISTYNGTSFLESLSQNIPTIIFWNPALWELREEAIPYFESLKSVGIFHENALTAAAKLEEIWDDVIAWWDRPEVQEARANFCYRYARLDKQPNTVLKHALLI